MFATEAEPKSEIFASHSCVSSMLGDLTSLCAMLFWCKKTIAAHTSFRMERPSGVQLSFGNVCD